MNHADMAKVLELLDKAQVDIELGYNNKVYGLIGEALGIVEAAYYADEEPANGDTWEDEEVDVRTSPADKYGDDWEG